MSDYFDFNETENTETNDTAPAKAETDIGHVVTADELTLDEGAIIREQERLAQEKKKKNQEKKTEYRTCSSGSTDSGSNCVVLCLGQKDDDRQRAEHCKDFHHGKSEHYLRTCGFRKWK